MSLTIFCSKFGRNLLINAYRYASAASRRLQSTETSIAASPPSESEHTDEAEYPEILDLSSEARKIRKRVEWHEAVKKAKTIEEKLIKVNMPKYYGFQMMMMTEERFPYDCLPYIQHYTRTQYESGLPSGWCKRSAEEIDSLVNEIKGHIEESVQFQLFECRLKRVDSSF